MPERVSGFGDPPSGSNIRTQVTVRSPSIIVRPRHPATTTYGLWFVRLSLPWAIASMLGADVLLSWAGLSPNERPLAVRLAVLAVGVLPVAIVVASTLLVRVPGFDWLFARPQPLAFVDDEGLDLTLPLIGRQHFAWEEIGSLKFRGRWNAGSELRTPGGELLATVPDELVHPKVYMRTAYTLAESVVQARPSRYALAPDRPSLGRPASFDLRERVGSGVDLAAWKRRRDSSLAVVLGGLVLLGIIGGILLLVR
jgi:hypothetical protein